MPQLIAPVIAGATGLSLGVSSTIASVGLWAATTAASTLIQMANQPKQDIGTKLHPSSGGAVPQSVVYAEKETAGSLIYAGTWGRAGKTPNTYYVRVFALCDKPTSGIKNPVWWSDKKETLDFDILNYTDVDTDFPGDGSGYSGDGQCMGWPVTSTDHDGNHYSWIKILDGSQTVADPYLMAKFGILAERPWASDMIGIGRTLMIVTQRYTVVEADQEASVAVVLKGIKDYDWRNDSTNGGSGAQRWGNEATYNYNPGNNVQALYNLFRGIYYGDTWLLGGNNWPARRFDTDTWTAAANACDENVALKAGGTQKRFRFGAEIGFNEEPLTIADRLLACGNGRLVESGGVYKIYVGGIGAPVLSITDDDIIITEELTGKLFPTEDEICNTVTGTYIEPANGGQAKAYKKRTKAEYVAADHGRILPKEMNFDYVRDNIQAQRLASHGLNENRRMLTLTITLPSWARKLEPCDVISWTSSSRGYDHKKFIVGDVTLFDTGLVVLVLREADPTDSDWNASADEQPYTVGIYSRFVVDNQTIDITVTPFGKMNRAGTRKIPAARIAWPTDVDMADCKAIRWRYKRLDDDDPDVDGHGREEFDAGKAVIEGLVRDTDYKVQAKIIPYSDRETEWCDWVTFTTGDYRVTDDDTDDTAPNAPSTPTISQITTDVKGDGSIDSALNVAWSAPVSGRTPKKYYVEIFRSTSIGTAGSLSGYTAWKDKTTKNLSWLVDANTRYYHKARVTAITQNDVAGTVSGVTSVGVQPLQYTPSIPTPTLTITRKPRGFFLKWTKWQDNTFLEAIVTRDGVEVFRGKTNSWTDHEDLVVTTSYSYAVTLTDKQGRSGATSTAVPVIFRGVSTADIDAGQITDALTDQTTPGAPGTPSLVSTVANYDRDNKLEAGLTITFTAPGSGRTPKKYLVEVYRATAIGTTNSLSGYTLWKDFTTHKLSTAFRANSRFYHKCVVTPISANDVQGTPSAATSVGVEPDAPSLTLSAPTTMGANIFSHGFYLSWTDPTISGTNFDHTEVEIQGNSSGVWEYLGNVETNHFYYPNRYATIQARICHVDSFGNKTAKYTSSIFTGNLIQLAELDTNSVDRTKIIDGEIIFTKLAANVFQNGNAALAIGALGTTAFLKKTSTGTASPGDTVAGGNLAYSDTSLASGSSPTGTWMSMGRCTSGNAGDWLRVA